MNLLNTELDKMDSSGSGNRNNGSNPSSQGLTQAEKDNQMKQQLRASLNVQKKAAGAQQQMSQAERDEQLKMQIKANLSQKSQVARDEQMKKQIRANLDAQKLSSGTSRQQSQVQRDEQLKQQLRSSLDSERRSQKQMTQEQKDEQMKQQLRVNLNSGMSSNNKKLAASNTTQAEKDNAMKKQLRASLNSQQQNTPTTQAQKDEAMKKQIRANLNNQGNSAAASGNNEDRVTQVERDVEMKARLRASLNATGTQQAASHTQAERDDEMKRQIRANLDNPPRDSSAGSTIAGEIGDSTTDSALRDSMTSKARARSSETSGTGDGQTPGAFSVQGRAYGNLPAWGRPQNRTSNASTPENSNIPPEMRSSIPPEMRAMTAPDSLPEAAVVAGSDDHGTSEDEAACADVSIRPEVHEQEEKSNTSVWVYLVVAVIVIGIVVAVVVVVAGSGSKEMPLTEFTTRPTSAPTKKPERCTYSAKIPFKNFTDDVLDTYDILRDKYISTVIPGFDPAFLPADRCGPMDLAISWSAYDLVKRELDVSEFSGQRFLLAFLYTSLDGKSWSTSKLYHYLRDGDECGKWERVGCDDDLQVISLDFRGIDGLSLAGTIPTEIGLLTNLSKCCASFADVTLF